MRHPISAPLLSNRFWRSTAVRKPANRRRHPWRWRLLFYSLLLLLPVVFKLDCMFYYPDRHTYWQPRDFGLRAEDVHFSSRDGARLHGWWLPALIKPVRGTIVHFHGNAANISNHVALVSWLPYSGYNVLMFDYHGYGRSEGRVNRIRTRIDGHAAIDYVLSRPDVDRQRLFAYGQSLGGAIAVTVAADRPEVKAVVAEGAFGDYRELAAQHLARRLGSLRLARLIAWALISRGDDALCAIRKISPRPLLIIAGEQDSLCFPGEGRRLYEAAGEPREFWLVPGAGHLSILSVAGDELQRRVLEFLGQAAGPAESKPAAASSP